MVRLNDKKMYRRMSKVGVAYPPIPQFGGEAGFPFYAYPEFILC